MSRTFTFNELRRLKDMLPDGTIQRIADELGLKPETVRNYFGGANFREGRSTGIHIEPGPDGGIVKLDDTTILDYALKIMREERGDNFDFFPRGVEE
ncbi:MULTISPECIES: hypothetical protein [Porphyromonas]|uniref:hypothetical protein n=1 Tax=Porphyromonas TaxID=836 RepID=UPI0006918E31|nr:MULTISPECIES: hypothetical protein [Porphyromonas]